MNITFFGAAREVTGSCSLLESNGYKILVDCGMFQGDREHEKKNTNQLGFDPKEINTVIVTHAHLDHVGRLPLLIKNGFDGALYATPATIELAELIMEDAFQVMTYNSTKTGSPVLYSETDIAGVMQQFKPLEYHDVLKLPTKNGDIQVKLYDVGHIFGSAFAEIIVEGKKVVFSGDVGNVNVPILRKTEDLPSDIDVLVCEATYGDRLHESAAKRQDIIESMVNEAISRGGVLMIPSFSLERTQELIYDLNDLIDRKKRLARVPIFLDSPLAIKATRVYRKYKKYYNTEALKMLEEDDDLFKFDGLTMCETSEESKVINNTRGPKIIIAGAGMMTGGRILHHAIRYLSGKENTLLIIGYQATGTLGRKILEGESPVNVMGESVAVNCQIKAIGALSAHADQKKLVEWIGSGKNLPKKVILNHGEPLPVEGLIRKLKEVHGINAVGSMFQDTLEI